MLNDLVSDWVRWLGGAPCFRIYGKAKRESNWRIIEVYATERRDLGSRWPLWSGCCTTWSDCIIAVGWDFAAGIVDEQARNPASRQYPVEVAGGRLHDVLRRAAAQGASYPTSSEVLAHECGHTWQARRLGLFYLPVVGSVTLFREGNRPWNRFENDASADGQFGGLLNGSVCPRLAQRLIPSR